MQELETFGKVMTALGPWAIAAILGAGVVAYTRGWIISKVTLDQIVSELVAKTNARTEQLVGELKASTEAEHDTILSLLKQQRSRGGL